MRREPAYLGDSGSINTAMCWALPVQWGCLCPGCHCRAPAGAHCAREGLTGSGEHRGESTATSQVFLSSVLLIPNQFLQLPSVISSPPIAAVWGFSCSASVEVPAPFKSLWKNKGACSSLEERRNDKVWGLVWLGFFGCFFPYAFQVLVRDN